MPIETETTGALDERVRTELLPDLEVLRSLGTGTNANGRAGTWVPMAAGAK